jgi:hypothetical protein
LVCIEFALTEEDSMAAKNNPIENIKTKTLLIFFGRALERTSFKL